MNFQQIFIALQKADNPLATLGIFAIFILIAVVIHFVLFFILGRIASKKDGLIFHHAVKKLRTPSLLLIIFLAILFAIPVVHIRVDITQWLRHLLSIFIIIAIAGLSIRGVAVGRIFILNRYDVASKDNLQARKVYTQLRMLERIVNLVIIILAIGTILMTFSTIRQVGASLLASAGIAGVILGFAAQRSLATIFAGFQIAITQPIRIDDVVIVEGEWGRIEEITLTYAVVRIWDLRRLIVPITYFIEKPFQNWTRVSADILGTVYLYTDYYVPIEAIRQELTRLLSSNDDWDGKVNVLQVTDAKESTLELRALMSAKDSSSAWNLRVFVREKLVDFLQTNYPSSLPRTRIVFIEPKKGLEKPEYLPGKPK